MSRKYQKYKTEEACCHSGPDFESQHLEVLATFMGHDINIHRSFYQLPQEIIEVARMGRLLTAFNKGTIGQFSRKSIDHINLELGKMRKGSHMKTNNV